MQTAALSLFVHFSFSLYHLDFPFFHLDHVPICVVVLCRVVIAEEFRPNTKQTKETVLLSQSIVRYIHSSIYSGICVECSK